jgi:zinc protease
MDIYLKQDPAVDMGFILNEKLKILNEIGLDEINVTLHNWIEKKPIIVANIIDIDSVPEFKNDGLEIIYNNVQATNPVAYVSSNPENLLNAEIKASGKVEHEEIMESYGITKWTLSNGATVILKPTDFENDEILFSSISIGGTSQYSTDDLVTAELASKVAYMSGLNGISFNKIRSMMQLKGVRVGTWVNQYSEGSSGYSDGQGIEELLEMNYLYFQGLKADSAAAAAFLSRLQSQLQSLKNEPDNVFSDTITKVLYGSDSRRLALSENENFEQFNLLRANQIVKERFSDPSGFTFIIVGNFVPEQIKPLVEKYIGGMTGDVKNESLPKEDYFAIKENTDITIYSGKAEKSMVDITYFGELPYTMKNRATVKVMTEVLKINLRKALREEKGGVYGISVSSDFNSVPVNHFKFDIFFQCATDLVDTLTNEMYRQIEIIKTEGPDQETLDKVKSVLKSEYEQNLKKNKYWQDQLTDIYGFDKEIDKELSEYMPAIMAVNSSDVQKLCRKKLKKNNMFIAKMYPESSKQD